MRYGGFLHGTTFWHNFVVPDISRNFSGFAGDSQKGWHNIEKSCATLFRMFSGFQQLDWHNNTTFLNPYVREKK